MNFRIHPVSRLHHSHWSHHKLHIFVSFRRFFWPIWAEQLQTAHAPIISHDGQLGVIRDLSSLFSILRVSTHFSISFLLS